MKLALHFVPHMKLDRWSLFFTHKNKIIGTHRICMATYAWMKKVCYCLFPDELFMDWSVWFHQNVGNWTYFLFKKQESSTFRGLSLLLLRYINNYSIIISLRSFLCSSCHLWLLLFDMIFFFLKRYVFQAWLPDDTMHIQSHIWIRMSYIIFLVLFWCL